MSQFISRRGKVKGNHGSAGACVRGWILIRPLGSLKSQSEVEVEPIGAVLRFSITEFKRTEGSID